MDKKKKKRQEAGRLGGIASAKVKQKSSDAKPLNKTKLENTKINNINDRNAKFKKEVFKFSSTESNKSLYNQTLLADFYNYWSEPNKSNTKMKWELQQTFDIKRRLVTWLKNDFGSKNSNGIKNKINLSQFRMPDGKNYIGYCKKCDESSFYNPFGFDPNLSGSTCCNDLILPKRKNQNV